MIMVLGGISLAGAENPGMPASTVKPKLSEKIVHEVDNKLPKYDPSSEGGKESLPAAEEPNASPDVLRLPTVTVTAETPLPPEWAMVTPKERLDRAIKARPGLKIGNIFGTNNGYALEMQREEHDVQKKAGLTEIISNTRTDNSAESRRIDRLLKDAVALPGTGWTK
jgi:hypothetical protein